MYKKIMGILRKRRREKGIAVVFVLGILGLLTVIGLGFASTALLDNKISSNNTNVGKARLLARSAYMRAYLLMREGAAASNIVTLDSSRDYDWLWRLNTTMDGIDLFALPANYNPGTNAGENQRLPSWQYVYDNTTSSNRQIIGRFAYVVKEEVGKMDPSVHFGKYLASKNAAVPLKRFGTSESELIYRDAVNAADAVYSNILDELFEDLYKKHDSLGAESFASPARWQDFTAMISEYSGSVDTTVMDNIRNVTETLHAGAPETFWIDKDNDTKQTSDEMFHRFNLARTDWDKDYFDDVNILFGRNKDGTVFVSKVNGLDEKCVFNARPSGDKNLVRQNKDRENAEDTGTADSCYDTGGIHWLGKWEDNPASLPDAWTEALRRKQIAANIIQYCRKDTSRTVSNLDVSVTDWANADAEPLYAGVGKHPMLNEVGFKCGVSGTAAVTNSVGEQHTVKWQYVILPQVMAELIDIYNIPVADRKKAQVRFFGEIVLDYKDIGTDAFNTRTVTLSNVNIDIPKEEWTSSASTAYHEGYTKGTYLPGSEVVIEGTVTVNTDDPDAAVADLVKKLAVKNVKLKLNKVYLRYENSDGTMMDRDFAKINREFSINDQESGGTKIIGDPKFFACAASANDPRVNHYQADWTPLSIFKTATATDANPVDVKGDVFDSESEVALAMNQIATPGRNNFDASTDGSIHSANVKYDHRKFGYNSATKKSYENQEQYDMEEGMKDPANGTVSTAYIAQKPMLSLWELGAISRAEPWRTINLKKSVPHPAAANKSCGGKDTVLAVGTNDSTTLAGEGYKAGDGNILDQVKINRLYLGDDREKALGNGSDVPAYITPALRDHFWTERISSFGKVNINTLQENVVKALFKRITFNATELPSASAEDREAYYSFIGKEDTAEPGTMFNETTLAGTVLRDPAGAEPKKVFFKTRSDILLPFFALDFSNSGKNDAAQEQLIGKTMNLLKAEPLDKAYIIALGQTIKAVQVPAGSPRYFDWNRDGIIDSKDKGTVTNDKMIRTKYKPEELAWKNAGYVRYPLAAELHGDSTHQKDTRLRGVAFGSKTLENEYTREKGKDTYHNGVDLITGTAKVIVTLERVDGKWKVVRYEYVD